MKVKNPTLDGAVLTGDVTAPTQSADDNSTKIATTAYADDAGGSVGAGTVGRAELKTATVTSLAGIVNAAATVNIVMTHYCFFPMIHTSNDGDAIIIMSGHETDGVSADSPRFSFRNDGSNDSFTYDVDYRYITA